MAFFLSERMRTSSPSSLFELIVAGELDTIFGMQGSTGLHFRKVKARCPMDSDKADWR